MGPAEWPRGAHREGTGRFQTLLLVTVDPSVIAAYLQRFKISTCISTLPVNTDSYTLEATVLPRLIPRFGSLHLHVLRIPAIFSHI